MMNFRREISLLGSRRAYLFAMIFVPVGVALFFLSLMDKGLPDRVPTAVVDLDNTTVTRSVVSSLNAQQTVEIVENLPSYHDAVAEVQSGKIFGFFLIPDNFTEDAVAGNDPTITYYCNATYFVPGSIAFKGFKTMAVGTSGVLAQTSLRTAGIGDNLSAALLQPVVFDTRPIGNPWLNYNIYLSNSFLPCLLELMIFLVTVMSVCNEIKRGTSPEWLRANGGSVYAAMMAKLLPQTVIFCIVGIFIQALLYGYNHFPLNGSTLMMIVAMIFLVIASQSFAVIMICLLPNMRFAMSLCSLIGILAFSIAGFSFPVDQMYGAIGIFSYILPIRYYFMIYGDQALNGYALYYSRIYYAALLMFPLVATAMIPMLRRHFKQPVYIP